METLIFFVMMLQPLQPNLCDQEAFVDPDFYLEPRIEYDGHLWRPVLMEHHPECPCIKKK